jgi:hypothetical protein
MLCLALKDPRLIFDAAKRFTAFSTPINMMTSTHLGTELDCLYGDVLLRLYERVYDLRVTYPNKDIVMHANDVKSCFKQMKLHPDIMPAFSIMVADFLFLQTALPFGADFSPQNWEPVRRLIEILAEKLFDDKTLRAKHRKYLDKLQWNKALGNRNVQFVKAKSCSKRQGVLDANGDPAPTPQDLFVDDSLYAEVYEHDRDRIEQTIAAGIEAIFILLGQSDLTKRQDPISFDKMTGMVVSFVNKLLGQLLDTRRLDVGVPPTFIADTLRLLKPFHSNRKSFTVKEMEKVTGMIVHISSSTPWIKFLLAQMYISIAAGLKKNQAFLVRTNKQFRQLLKDSKSSDKRTSTFGLSQTSKKVHSCDQPHWINQTLREELHLIIRALENKRLKKRTPLAHLVRRDPSAKAWSDSCLYAAGGFSSDMKFWWYLEWPKEILECTLKFVKNNEKGDLISINVLEYAAGLINYAAAYHYYLTHPDPNDPYPVVKLYLDNTASESWIIKACKGSLAGRALSRLQCAMMINNPVGIQAEHVTTVANVIADEISRIKKETNSLRGFASILQAYPEVAGCRRFQPSAALLSHIMDAISLTKSVDPMEVSNSILTDPGQIIS